MGLRNLDIKTRKKFIKENFCIELYEKCRELKAAGWSDLLHFRGTLLAFCNKDIWTHDDDDGLVLSILAEPVRDDVIGMFGRGAPSPYVYGLNLIDIYELHEWCIKKADYYEPDNLKFAQDCNRIVSKVEDMAEVPERLLHEYNTTLRRNGDPVFYVCVDLAATDEQLKAEFSEWLQSARLIRNKEGKQAWNKSTFSDSDFSKWCDYKILGYIDLLLIEQLCDVSFSNHEKGNLLFPDSISDDVDVAERVRKVVAPLSKKLLNTSTLDSLVAFSRTQSRSNTESE